MGIRNRYSEMGVDKFYVIHGGNYQNPHEGIIADLMDYAKDKSYIGKNVLDLCCGSGEVTMCLEGYNVIGIDPYTSLAYLNRTGKHAIKASFMDIIMGALDGLKFDTIICSFALHLCERSLLPQVLYRLSMAADTLIVISPNKKPDCDGLSWTLVDEVISNRVRMRVYK